MSTSPSSSSSSSSSSSLEHETFSTRSPGYAFYEFLQSVLPSVESKSRQMNQALWLLETTGNRDAAILQADLETELNMLLGDRTRFSKVMQEKHNMVYAPYQLRRCYKVWVNTCLPHCIDPKLLRQIADQEAKIRHLYATFRPELDGQRLTEEDIRNHLKQESNPKRRQQVWEASKEIGSVLAPEILSLVTLRNHAAQSLGYKNFFEMRLKLSEINLKWLVNFFNHLTQRTEAAHTALMHDINTNLAKRFQVPIEELGPWAWADPFGQEDPLTAHDLDACLEGVDICAWTTQFYDHMGFDVRPILQRSDLYPREGKNQHAFCVHIDRRGDIRTLNNITQSMRWLETLLHELGHAIYEVGLDPKLPWLLREPPHMFTTEAIAMLMGRQAYHPATLRQFPHTTPELIASVQASARRRQLIVCRWVLTMTAFEQQLYGNPSQDLNALWWNLVGSYQKIRRPKGREGKCDWAAKYHIGLAPVYYYSYLLGELFASCLEKLCLSETKHPEITQPAFGTLLKERLFLPGNRLGWRKTIEHVLQDPLSATPWIKQFATTTSAT